MADRIPTACEQVGIHALTGMEPWHFCNMMSALDDLVYRAEECASVIDEYVWLMMDEED